jgi:hypothetical protein
MPPLIALVNSAAGKTTPVGSIEGTTLGKPVAAKCFPGEVVEHARLREMLTAMLSRAVANEEVLTTKPGLIE